MDINADIIKFKDSKKDICEIGNIRLSRHFHSVYFDEITPNLDYFIKLNAAELIRSVFPKTFLINEKYIEANDGFFIFFHARCCNCYDYDLDDLERIIDILNNSANTKKNELEQELAEILKEKYGSGN